MRNNIVNALYKGFRVINEATKKQIIEHSKQLYQEILSELPKLSDFEREVAENITLLWARGNNWLGGLPDSVANKQYEKIEKMGYSWEEIDKEFNRQMDYFEDKIKN